MLNNAEKQIIATVAYYDEMDYPLTSFEIWKSFTNYESITNIRIDVKNGLQQEKLGLSETIKLLESEELRKYVENYNGFYFLKGRKELVEKRIKKNKIASLKLKRLRRIVWFLRFIPFVRMIAVTGRLAMKNAEKNSDWDLFVALKKGRIWTGRTLITAFVHLIGKRRYGNKIKDRICLNYFITDESLKINIEERPLEVNLFSASEYSFIIVLFGFKVFRKFQIRNQWIREFKPNFEISEVRNMKMISDNHFSKVLRNSGERLLGFDFIENFLRKIEREKIANNPKTHLAGSVIEANDETLVFLPEPQGKEIYEKTLEKLESLGL
jgi:hypothetical protein